MPLKKIGALWRKKDKNGKDYFSGTINFLNDGDNNVMIFENDKQAKNHPDMVVHLLTDEDQD